MSEIQLIVMALGAMSAFYLALFVICDLCGAIKAKIKSEQYKSKIMKFIKEEIDWKQACLIVVWIAIVLSAYWPFFKERKEDYRAERQKAEYSALYACYYDIPHYGNGVGHVLISHADGLYIIERVYTSDGIVLVEQEIDLDDLEDDEFDLCFCGWHDSYFEVKEGPLSYSEVNYNDTKISFGYPEPNAKYCYKCSQCEEWHHKKCIGNH